MGDDLLGWRHGQASEIYSQYGAVTTAVNVIDFNHKQVMRSLLLKDHPIHEKTIQTSQTIEPLHVQAWQETGSVRFKITAIRILLGRATPATPALRELWLGRSQLANASQR